MKLGMKFDMKLGMKLGMTWETDVCIAFYVEVIEENRDETWIQNEQGILHV